MCQIAEIAEMFSEMKPLRGDPEQRGSCELMMCGFKEDVY